MMSKNEVNFPAERSTKVTFADEEMSRLRSDTYIKPGSESSFDSEDLNSRRYRQELESYCCCTNVSALGALIVSVFISIVQTVAHFVILLFNCEVTMFDIVFSIWPVVTVTVSIIFAYFAYDTHTSSSLKPYIGHHMQLSLFYSICLISFALASVKQQLFLDVITFLAKYSVNLSHLLATDEEKKLKVAGFLSSQLLISVFCLHLSGPLFSWLSTEKKYISTECTEVV